MSDQNDAPRPESGEEEDAGEKALVGVVVNAALAEGLAVARAALSRERTLREALEKIERWEMPVTGEFYPSGNPVSYEAQQGSIGAREYIRALARAALASPSTAEEGR